MKAFPPVDDLSFLVDLELDQIILNPWSVVFCFRPMGKINVESLFEHITSDGVVHRHTVADRQASPLFLYELVQQRIEAISAEAQWLELTFTKGAKLRIFADLESGYESGQIHETDDTRFCTVF